MIHFIAWNQKLHFMHVKLKLYWALSVSTRLYSIIFLCCLYINCTVLDWCHPFYFVFQLNEQFLGTRCYVFNLKWICNSWFGKNIHQGRWNTKKCWTPTHINVVFHLPLPHLFGILTWCTFKALYPCFYNALKCDYCSSKYLCESSRMWFLPCPCTNEKKMRRCSHHIILLDKSVEQEIEIYSDCTIVNKSRMCVPTSTFHMHASLFPICVQLQLNMKLNQ